MTSLSTHVLDTATGAPAAGVEVTVDELIGGEWTEVSKGTTDVNGRVVSLGARLGSGTFRLVFATEEYGSPFFPRVHVVVNLDEEEDHYHVPLLLSPYGYTTYRGG